MRRTEHLTSQAQRLQSRLRRLVGQAIADYGMIEDGDRVMVCVSGGKDSHALLDLLVALRERAPVAFDLVAVNLDQKQPGFPAEVLPDYLTTRGIPFHIETADTYSTVTRVIPPGETYCSLCSRLRRGLLYRVATRLGATKIALGHHRDDIVETLLLNMLFNGRLKAMPPKLRSSDGRHVVIRPLAYVREDSLTRYSEARGFPIVPCDLCGSQEDLKRKQMKEQVRDWERRFPGSGDNIMAALTRVVPSHLMDRRLFDFSTFRPIAAREDAPRPSGDDAFEAWDDVATTLIPLPHVP